MTDNYIGFIVVIIIIKVLFIISYLVCKCCKSSKGQTYSQRPVGPVVVQSYPANTPHQGIFIIQNPQNQQQRMVLPYEQANLPNLPNLPNNNSGNESINVGPKNGPYDEAPPQYDQLFPR